MAWGLDTWGSNAWSYGVANVTATSAGVLNLSLGSETVKIDVTPTFSDLGGITLTLGSPETLLWSQVGTDTGELWGEVQTGQGVGFTDVVLLCGMDQSNPQTDVTDESSYARSPFTLGDGGGSTGYTFTSGQFDNAIHFERGRLGYAYTANSSDFHFGNEDFTIEFWAKVNPNESYVTTRKVVSLQGSSPQLGWVFFIAEINFGFTYSTTGSDNNSITALWFPQDTSYHHFAVTRNNNVLYLFLDGELETTEEITSSLHESTAALSINGVDDGVPPGNGDLDVDELRIIKGHGIYTNDFTVPTEKFPRDSVFDQNESWTELSTGTSTWTQIGF